MDTKEFIKNAAERNGWAIQSKAKFLDTVTSGLEKTLAQYGYYLCPCREGWGARVKDRDIICPCDYAAGDIEEFGQCYCSLFLSAEKAASDDEPEAIPDRRPEDKYPD